MKTAKLIFYALVILLAALGAFAVYGLVVAAIPYLFGLVAILLVGFVVVKMLKKSDKPQLKAVDPDRELKEAIRQLEEIKRKQFLKP
jgi:uncharacterized membrane-anchored protein YhcB (DUF1043 family)